MNQVKVFPIRLSQEFHQMIAEAAKEANKSIHQFILDSIEKELKK